MKVYNSATLSEERKANAAKIMTALAFRGDKFANLRGNSSLATRFVIKNEMDELQALRHKITNAAQAPAASDIEAFFGKFYIELARRVAESMDLTTLIAREQTDLDFSEVVTIRELLPFRGFMGVVQGTNDPVPLIEQNTGVTDTLTLYIKALGWKDSLKNLLYNKFFTMERVIQAAADAYMDERNKDVIGSPIIGATFAASQQVGADGTSGQTLDEHTYNTILAAVKKLRGLKDIFTAQKIVAPAINILCNSADTWQIENVIRGQLNGNGSSARASNRPALPINAVVEYDHGINHLQTVGKVTGSFPGVTAGKCYLYVPDVMLVAKKRPLTMESGVGSVLELSTEERAWYGVQGVYTKQFMGSSHAEATVGAGYGYIVEVTLPTT